MPADPIADLAQRNDWRHSAEGADNTGLRPLGQQPAAPPDPAGAAAESAATRLEHEAAAYYHGMAARQCADRKRAALHEKAVNAHKAAAGQLRLWGEASVSKPQSCARICQAAREFSARANGKIVRGGITR